MISLLIYIVILAAQWFVYKKMGREGWEGIVPLYNTYVMFDVIYGNGWSCLKILIPFYGIYVIIKSYIDLAHEFNKSTAFGWGLFLAMPIFMCIIAFSNDIQFRDGSNAVNSVETIFGSDRPFENISNSFNKEAISDADVLLKYKELLDNGAITEEEFSEIKKKVLKI